MMGKRVAALLLLAAGCGRSLSLANGLTDAAGLATDGVFLYWIDNGAPGALRKMPIGSGPITTLAEGLGPVIRGPDADVALPLGGLKVQSGSLYWWGTDSSASPAAPQLFTLPSTGGTPQALPGALGDGELLIAFDVLGSDLFVELASQTSFILRRIRLASPTVHQDLYTETYAGAKGLVAPFDGFGELVATSAGLFFKKVDRDASGKGTTGLYRRAIGDDPGAALVPVAQDVAAAKLLADDSAFYWVQSATDGSGDRLMSLPFAGGAATSVLQRPSLCLAGVGGGALFAFDCARPDKGPDQWTLVTLPAAGGKVRTLATENGSDVASLLVYGGAAYWLERRPPRPLGTQAVTWEIRTAR